MIRLEAAAIALASILLAPALAGAAPPGAPPPSFAERHPELAPTSSKGLTKKEEDERKRRWLSHFDRGNAALASGDFKKCEDHFAQAWALQPTPGVLANLGLCENELGYYTDAAEHLRRARMDFDPKGKSEDDVRRFETMTEAQLQRALKEIGTLDVQNAPAGATITVGPALVFKAPLDRPIYLYPGDHAVQVRTADGVLHSERLHVVAGGEYTSVVRPRDPPPPAPPAPVVPPAPAGPRLPLVVSGGAGAGAFLGVAIGFLAASHARLNDAASLRAQLGTAFGSQTGACHEPAGARVDLCNRLDAATDDAAVFEYVAIGALVTSGALALGTTVYGLWPRSSSAPSAPKTGAAVVRAGAAVWPGGASVAIEGVF